MKIYLAVTDVCLYSFLSHGPASHLHHRLDVCHVLGFDPSDLHLYAVSLSPPLIRSALALSSLLFGFSI